MPPKSSIYIYFHPDDIFWHAHTRAPRLLAVLKSRSCVVKGLILTLEQLLPLPAGTLMPAWLGVAKVEMLVASELHQLS